MTRQQCINIITAYIRKRMRVENFVQVVLGTISYKGKQWQVWNAAICNQREFGDRYGAPFLRLHAYGTSPYMGEEIEVWLDDLSDKALNILVDNNPKFINE